MAKNPYYHAAEHGLAETAKDPYLRPAFSVQDRIRRQIWNLCWMLLYRLSPRPMHGWRAMVLRAFGATMGPNCHFYPGARIWAPWNLHCDDQITAGDGAEIYNPAPMHFGSHAIVSQGAYICGATRDFNDPAFPWLAYSMHFGAYAWVCAKACVGSGGQCG